MSDEVLKKYKLEDVDKVAEYEKIKEAIKTLKRDLRQLNEEHDLYDEVNQLKKKLKQLRDTVKEDPQIKQVNEKIKELKERLDLLKEMIKMDLIETSSSEVKLKDKMLRLVYVLKEVSDDKK